MEENQSYIVCAGKSEQFDFAQPVGIGMTEVAINLTRLCLTKKPKFILFVGTAGSYGEKKIFDIIESKTASNIENSFFTGGSYTSNYITTDKSLGKYYLAQNIHLENMEYYAVLKVAQAFGISAGGIFKKQW